MLVPSFVHEVCEDISKILEKLNELYSSGATIQRHHAHKIAPARPNFNTCQAAILPLYSIGKILMLCSIYLIASDHRHHTPTKVDLRSSSVVSTDYKTGPSFIIAVTSRL